MHIPDTVIVRVECDDDARLLGHKDGVAENPRQPSTVDLDPLKSVSVQVHWQKANSSGVAAGLEELMV